MTEKVNKISSGNNVLKGTSINNTNNPAKALPVEQIFSPENLSKNTVVNLDPNSETNKMYNYVQENCTKNLTPKEEKNLQSKAKNAIEERNRTKGHVETYIGGIVSDVKEDKIGERIANNPVVKATGLVLGGLTSCTPINNEHFDLVESDYTDPVATGPVNKNCLKLHKALGLIMVSDITPIQKIVAQDTSDGKKIELKIDKENSAANKIVYSGEVTDIKTSEVKQLKNTVVQLDEGISVTEEVNESDNKSEPKWVIVSKSDYALDSKGRVAKFVEGKMQAYYKFEGYTTNKLYQYNIDGSVKVIDNFDATQVSGSMKF